MARNVRRSFGGSRIPQSLRRKTEWIASSDITTIQTLAASTAVLDQILTAATVSSLGPATIVRTIGTLWVKTDQVAATEIPFGAMGMTVVSEQASVAGVASVPVPITDETSDLFFTYVPWAASLILADATGIIDGMQVYQFDSRAQRKVQDGDAVAVTLENASSVHGVGYVLKFRMLFKLH